MMAAESKSPASWRGILSSVILIALVAAAMFVGFRRRPPVTVSAVRPALGTHVTLTVVAPTEGDANRHIDAAFARIEAIEQAMSSYRPDSELMRLNEIAGAGPVPVSDDVFAAIRAGVEWHRRSRGTFDVAVGPLLDLWRSCAKAGRLPTQEELDRIRPLLGAGRIQLDEAKKTVRFPVAGMRINLGGLGKGFCADEVAMLLRSRGVTSALIAVAGDIRALGKRADGRPWRIGVQDPRKPDAAAWLELVEIADMSVSTSGNYQRFDKIQGRRYSHIKDPRTGLSADNVPSVTVVAPDTLTTDILSTALSVLGVDEGLAWVEELPNAEALFITIDEDGEAHFVRSSGFTRYTAEGAGPPDYRR